ncbi:hypothetical protein BDFB_010571 [Asbolus verrucosus]|uniref:Uncharacterized protein n=1 Tax=Asbolus verrucosus TaxID=1661398 RepID=A0A482VFH7_ASBVE|nr:hypothetical protein BDFB_010571 [Asbolus verrucosus]
MVNFQHSIPLSGSEDDNGAQYTSLDSDCKQLLKASIFSLISYCRNVLGMTTAIAALENDTFSNGLRFKRSSLEDLEILYNHPRTKRNREFYDTLPEHHRNQLRNRYRFITKPEHTEVFKIRSKRQNHIEEPINEPEVPPKWDLLGVLSASIKLTFFGKLLEKEKEENPQLAVAQAEQGQIIGGPNHDFGNSLFNLVKESLANVEGCPSGFLMIVFGGCLKEIYDPYTDLMQSIKHVIENTDEKKTLIVVTGSCPIVDRALTDENELSIPVYVKGPSSFSAITFSSQLFDVPYGVKNALGDLNVAGT